MKLYQLIVHKFCSGDDLVKNSRSKNHTQTWLCKVCKEDFNWIMKWTNIKLHNAIIILFVKDHLRNESIY